MLVNYLCLRTDALQHLAKIIRGALTAITAAVVGVILNLSIWFALHVFFNDVTLQEYGPFVLWQPEIASLDWRVIALTLLSALMLFRFHWSVTWVLAVSALGGMGLVTVIA